MTIETTDRHPDTDFWVAVQQTDITQLTEKEKTYKGSWKRRGGRGAWFTIARPLDRLEVIVNRFDDDIFKACEADDTGADGSALACIRDLRRYFTLLEAEIIRRKRVWGGKVAVARSLDNPDPIRSPTSIAYDNELLNSSDMGEPRG